MVAELDRLGLRENTVIVFWGDHGYHLGEFGKWAKHGSLFEIGTRVPLIVVAPGAKGNGAAAPVPVQSLDIYPTLCELCGLKPPAGIEGHSLKPLLDDAKAKWDHPAYSVAGNAKNLGVAVRTAKYRYAEWAGGKNGAMLIDLAADPDETRNLIDDPKYAAVRDELSALARKHAAGGANVMSRLVLALAATLTASAAPAAGPARPNVLIVMTDDQGLGDFSYTGNPVLKTPNLDAFARESVRLTDFHVCPDVHARPAASSSPAWRPCGTGPPP